MMILHKRLENRTKNKFKEEELTPQLLEHLEFQRIYADTVTDATRALYDFADAVANAGLEKIFLQNKRIISIRKNKQ